MAPWSTLTATRRGAAGVARAASRASSGNHPRMRGEHLVPRLRAARCNGIIPACAGSNRQSCTARACQRGSSPHARGAPWPFLLWPFAFRDHPRMRGEHGFRLIYAGLVLGIIPACAGRTGFDDFLDMRLPGLSPHARGAPSRPPRGRTGSRDHPRMRGEHPTGPMG